MMSLSQRPVYKFYTRQIIILAVAGIPRPTLSPIVTSYTTDAWISSLRRIKFPAKGFGGLRIGTATKPGENQTAQQFCALSLRLTAAAVDGRQHELQSSVLNILTLHHSLFRLVCSSLACPLALTRRAKKVTRHL